VIRSHPAVAQRSVRCNVEADSLNSALLLPESTGSSAARDLLVREVVREVTVKSGQKCTAIRRVFVPEATHSAVVEQLAAKLAKVSVGNPRNETVRMGALVSRAQYDSVQHGIALLARQAQLIVDGRTAPLVDAAPDIAACVGPTLLAVRTPADADAAEQVHAHEVFGPVATVLPYRDLEHAQALITRGGGSLVSSLYGEDPTLLARTALALSALHGRVHVISPEAAAAHTGHGNVMPHSLHGGPGRAGGGEELGGLRALAFYQRRAAIQAAPSVLEQLLASGTTSV